VTRQEPDSVAVQDGLQGVPAVEAIPGHHQVVLGKGLCEA